MREPTFGGLVDDALGPSDLHRKRIEYVRGYIELVGARRVLDLGCGEGDLLLALASMEQLERLIGVDVSRQRLGICRAALDSITPAPAAVVELVAGSYADARVAFPDIDVAIMLESLEHYCPRRLSRIEKTILAGYRPKRLLISTPNKGYDIEKGLSMHHRRHAEHHFEWCQARFRKWVQGVALRTGYKVRLDGIWRPDSTWEPTTQIAIFEAITE
ncbi:hypothetical protein CEY09_12275 [Achromobacter marplatensis]|uniref:Small RNA 2'-O-methyltransferase n=1 Tax=Achromobacter marplatensis TaxID=470868 RepID=A0ABX9GEY9_9BURK|nr:class I SAM-dependent methyltransferase [Achromobacter marplatensis]OWT68678.1 hypothetical protein CEY09_12275 [Achromobacter marplatensis]RBP20871.1 methyltransferase family protein [Achromobacter marplatensis]CAB3677523.1 hypothetical protein LMG26219_04141 [Achromobacter marplatensis]